jgi:hypothetical protein
MYNDQNYLDAIGFALNYPPDYNLTKYDIIKDIFKVDVFDGGWYSGIRLQGSFVRSCLKWKGIKKWKQ